MFSSLWKMGGDDKRQPIAVYDCPDMSQPALVLCLCRRDGSSLNLAINVLAVGLINHGTYSIILVSISGRS